MALWRVCFAAFEYLGGRPPSPSSLVEVCSRIQQEYFELCLQNEGRPAAAALVALVRAGCQAHAAGISLERLLLELEHGWHLDHHVDSPGFWLTAADRTYRSQWLKTVYFTCEELSRDDAQRREQSLPQHDADGPLKNLVRRTLAGQQSGEEQALVAFDRALATSGASGGVAAERKVIAPQLVPISQIVLVALKCHRELKLSGL
ncbi:hypothetical protein WJX81_003902 [Elliptochloris bilobata]|uniref:Nuclear pore complex protein Nup85 n=1 Tax=Elliptochloris bilobata TaxID=381761 RepID=A0AAW1S1I3_9CHLO